MIGYDVKCYRCGATETAFEATEAQARDAIERFQANHRRSCGDSASFFISTYGHSTAAPTRALTGDGDTER